MLAAQRWKRFASRMPLVPLGCGGRGLADKHLLAGWCWRNADRIERSKHFNARDSGDPVFASAGNKGMQHFVGLGVGSRNESHAHLVGAGLDSDWNVLESAVDGANCRGLFLIDGFDVCLPADLSFKDSIAV